MIKINHNPHFPAMCGCLLPIGTHLNQKLLELKQGDTFLLKDGSEAILKSFQKVAGRSVLTESICFLIYGISLDKFWEKIQSNYGNRLYEDNGLIFLTYKLKK